MPRGRWRPGPRTFSAPSLMGGWGAVDGIDRRFLVRIYIYIYIYYIEVYRNLFRYPPPRLARTAFLNFRRQAPLYHLHTYTLVPPYIAHS